MNTKYISKTIKVLFFIAIIIFIIYMIEKPEPSGLIPASSLSKQEQQELKIEDLEEKNRQLQDELSHTKAKLEDLEIEYKYDEELIDLLREQLESYNIEPYEL